MHCDSARRPHWGTIAFALALAIVPLAVLVYRLSKHGLNFPYWDEMLLVQLIDRAKAGHLRLIDFWTQHNEHRPLFPRLIMIGLALATDWNVAWELAANVVCGVGVFVCLCWAVLRAPDGHPRPWWVVPVLSFFVFSWAQMENWAWGFELTWFLCTLAVVAGILVLSDARFGWWGFVFAILMGVVATYSLANGLLYWFAAAPALFAAPDLTREKRVFRALLWGVAALLVIESYFVAYRTPTVSPSLTVFIHAPFRCLGFILLYLGSPVVAIFSKMPWHGDASHNISLSLMHFVPGCGGVAAFTGLLWRCRGVPLVRQAPYLGLAAFVLGSAIVTCLGRVGFGMVEGLTSRYMTTSALFWCALSAMLAMYLREHPMPVSVRTKWCAAALGAAGLLASNALLVHSNLPWEENTKWKRMGWQAILAGHEARLYLEDLSWDPARLRDEFLPILKSHHLSGFGRPRDPGAQQAKAYLEEARSFVERKYWFPAMTYIETALFLDPASQDAVALLDKIPEQIRGDFKAYESAPLAVPGP